ncbi:hypothetical protein GH714_030858 [Hevea brasiliensis]|uniref:S-locus receptor kinase C-terminal domain-containing protein n=1 Tax=Hevea brasiliensis TaxID=3981 RepID=A0A6A6NL87_HEVBR|nr:hypothetical protein GH714_030858 [Hevea brasiliensis]
MSDRPSDADELKMYSVSSIIRLLLIPSHWKTNSEKAWELWKEDALEILDPTMSDSAPRDQVLRCINVALLCVEHSPFDRPNMAEVLSMLSNEVQQLPMPKQPAFYVGTTTTNATMASTSGERGGETYSANGLSLTDMAGR